jgi:hypothetical protein
MVIRFAPQQTLKPLCERKKRKMKKFIIAIICLFIAFLFFWEWNGDRPGKGSLALYLGPTRVTQDSDREYQAALQKAQGYEARGQFEVAAKEYFEATKINRFNLPSYYPLLQSAKLKMAFGKKEEASRELESFVAFAKEELRITPPKRFEVQDTTAGHETAVKNQLKEAEQLLLKLK